MDEDDDVPAFAGGLGQMGHRSALGEPAQVMLSPAPRGHRSSLQPRGSSRGGVGLGSTSAAAPSRQKAGHSPAERVSPLPSEATENRGGRRQLPNGRSGTAFKQAIQEEDEDEEE